MTPRLLFALAALCLLPSCWSWWTEPVSAPRTAVASALLGDMEGDFNDVYVVTPTWHGMDILGDSHFEKVHITTALPRVIRWGFSEDGEQVVVESRGSRGPSTLELFDVKSGLPIDRVLKSAVQNGQPVWASRFAD